MGCCFGSLWSGSGSPSPHAAALLGSPRGSVKIGGLVLDRLQTVGEGGYAFVSLCRDAGPPERMIALKASLVDADEEADVQRAVAEAELLKRLQHANIVPYVAHAVRSAPRRRKEVLVAMQYCPGSVRDEMAAALRSKSRLPLQRVVAVACDVAAALAHMHGQSTPVAHRDVKAENVLVEAGGTCRLCDFGSATTVAREPANKLDIAVAEEEIARNTTLQYRAPEQIDLWQRSRIDERVDCWAVGVLLFYTLFLQLPFGEQPLQIANCTYSIPPHTPDACPPAAAALIKDLLVPDPAQRPDIWAVSEGVAAVGAEVDVQIVVLQRPEPVPRQPVWREQMESV